MIGKVVLITGASSGLGLSAAEAFAAAGADIALLARGRDGLRVAAERVERHHRKALIVPADVTDRDAVQAAVEQTVNQLGRLDVVVSCAAATVHGPFAAVDAEDFDRVVDVTLAGPVNVIRAALPHLEASGGVIVATGSLASKVPLPTFSSYAAAKHGQRGFLHTLRAELRASGSPVRVCMLDPGVINTPLWDQTSGDLPRHPPEGYDPAAVAEDLVDLARHPRPERTFGGETKAIELLWKTARPAGDFAMQLVHKYLRSGDGHAPPADILDEASDTGTTNGTLPLSRPSLTRPVKRLLGRVLPNTVV